ncbi:divergent PAP2 family protein [Marinicellulosiphila megalodicopiae]|uniref:divergent PAP2 family protein n=1 Tax=Marinicellulosiphila megalodicopiae TaxID=2724896 RepID=UPI003BB163EA
MMDYSYLLVPFVAWFVTGVSKFLINCIRAKRFAFDLIGYGGMPSNHSAIVSSTTCLIGLKEGIEHPAFAVAITLSFIVLLDASSLRMKIAQQSVLLNQLVKHTDFEQIKPLRERIGHTKFEILMGVVFGCLVATAIFYYYF